MDAGRWLSTRGHMADSWSRRGTPRWLWPVMPRGWSSAENGRLRLYHRSRVGGRRLTRRRASAKAWKRGGPGCADLRPHDQGISFREHPSKCQCRWPCVESRQGWPRGDDQIRAGWMTSFPRFTGTLSIGRRLRTTQADRLWVKSILRISEDLTPFDPDPVLQEWPDIDQRPWEGS